MSSQGANGVRVYVVIRQGYPRASVLEALQSVPIMATDLLACQ